MRLTEQQKSALRDCVREGYLRRVSRGWALPNWGVAFSDSTIESLVRRGLLRWNLRVEPTKTGERLANKELWRCD